MTFRRIEAKYVEDTGALMPTSVNSTAVVSVRASPRHKAHHEVALNMRDKRGNVVMLDSPEPLDVLLAAFGPMVALTIDEAAEKNPVYYVRPGAIVAVRHLPSGSARLWLTNGEAWYIVPESAGKLTVLIEREVADAVAAN